MIEKNNRLVKNSRVRLFIDMPLVNSSELELSADQNHYLTNVMRLGTGDSISVFNGYEGEWRATIQLIQRKKCSVIVQEQIRQQDFSKGPWLLFSPIRIVRTEFIIQKACELGVTEIWPVITKYTQNRRMRPLRARTQAIEAAEQCGRTDVPIVHPTINFENLLSEWPLDRRILFCDERGGRPILDILSRAKPSLWAILIGPEGGFSIDERKRLQSYDFTDSGTLGPRLVRSETAVVSALTLWQASLGDLGNTIDVN